MTSEHTELVPFRLLHMPCCGYILPTITARWPNFCPECGKPIYPQIRNSVLIQTSSAELGLHQAVRKYLDDLGLKQDKIEQEAPTGALQCSICHEPITPGQKTYKVLGEGPMHFNCKFGPGGP